MISVSCQSIARSEAEADAPASRTAGQIVGVYTDWLWFREVQFTSVFVTVLQTQILLGVVTGAAFFLILHGNVTLARRLATREALVVADDLPGLPSPEILQPCLGRLTLPVSVTLALFAGWPGTGRWELVLKALNPTPFGIRDPLFAGYRLAMFDLLFSERGVAFGAGWLHHLWQGTQRGRYAV